MSDTPRTDAVVLPGLDLADAGDIIELCRTLERENANLLAALIVLHAACELRANKEGGEYGEEMGPAAYQAEAAIAKATEAA